MISTEHARLKDHVASMTGGLEAKINEGFVLPRFSPFPLLGFYPALMCLIAAQIILGVYITISASLTIPPPNFLEPSYF